MVEKNLNEQTPPKVPATITILVVEDSLTQTEKLKYILEKEGFMVDCVFSGAEALVYLQLHRPTLVVSDVLMPEMNGFELCAAIKKNDHLSSLPVVLLTALTEPQDIIRGLECGADNFITKPYKEDYLLNQVKYMLANARLRETSLQNNSTMPDMGMEIYFAGKKHYIKSNQLQILDLLLSTFEVWVQKNKELEDINQELVEKHKRIKALNGLVPICANCKKIRDDQGYWFQVEQYLEDHSNADFNSSICPQCLLKESPDKSR